MWNVEQVASWHFSQLKFHFHRSRLNMYQYAFFIVTDFISTEMHVPCHCILLWTSVNPLDFVYHRFIARVITWSWTKPTFSLSLLFVELLVIPNKVLPLAVPYSIQSFHFPTSLVTILFFQPDEDKSDDEVEDTLEMFEQTTAQVRHHSFYQFLLIVCFFSFFYRFFACFSHDSTTEKFKKKLYAAKWT